MHQQNLGAAAFSELAASPWMQSSDEGHFTMLNPQYSLDSVPIFPPPASDFSVSLDPYALSQSHSSQNLIHLFLVWLLSRLLLIQHSETI